MQVIAHKTEDGREQPLIEHCRNVSKMASAFAKPFNGEKIAEQAGLNHDAGKDTDGFQRYIHDPEHNPKCPHSVIGAVICEKTNDAVSAAIIEGHHAGLHNTDSMLENVNVAIKTRTNDIEKVEASFPTKQCNPRELIPPYARTHRNMGMFSFVQMEYSCLVDADYLDTEAFMRKGSPRNYHYDSLSVIYDRLLSYVKPWITESEKLRKQAFEQLSKEQQINLMRTDMLLRCLKAGEKSGKGDIRTLSIPTGGSKTISSFAYAVSAAKHDEEISRIIIVTPYTTITSQTASVLRSIAGENNVLEHHSGYDFESNSNGHNLKLASENYDIPIVVTTDVQLFESFYSNKPSKSRKLHNLVNSVIIFDEVQQLPLNFLLPCVKCIEALAVNYGCRIVLCTATQPAIAQYFDTVKPQEIIEDSDKYSTPFRRCCIEDIGHISTEKLISQIIKFDECLCVVNEKEEAKYIYRELKKLVSDKPLYCLTTDITPYDKARYIHEIKQHLSNETSCIVISTSLIECGVDIDFPYGYRELSGLDSIFQTAGRINRNGKRDCNACKLFVFDGPQQEIRLIIEPTKTKAYFKDYLLNQKQFTKKLLSTRDAMSMETSTKYFSMLYRSKKAVLDEKDILDKAMPKDNYIRFQDIATKFHMIEEDTVTVIIPQTQEAIQLIDKIRNRSATRDDIRKVGKYSVNVRRNSFDKYLSDAIEPLVTDSKTDGKTYIGCLPQNNISRYTEYGLQYHDI